MAAFEEAFAAKDEVNYDGLKWLAAQAALAPDLADSKSLDADFHRFQKLVYLSLPIDDARLCERFARHGQVSLPQTQAKPWPPASAMAISCRLI